MDNPTPALSADELRKQKRYQEAIPLYEKSLETRQNARDLHGLIHCYRKSGQVEKAFTIGQDALKQFPQNQYIRGELAWVIYDRQIKPNKEKGAFGEVIKAAERALKLDPENALLVKVVVLAVMKAGKNANNPPWKTISQYALRLEPGALADEKRSTSNGKSFMSEKEEWFVNTSHALYKSGEFHKAVEIAQSGLEIFPNEMFLIRTNALALFRSGAVQEAAEKMRPLLKHPRCDWYVRSELAEIEEQLGNTKAAYSLLCQALLNRQEEQFKLRSLEQFGGLALKVDKLDEARAALAFARVIRTERSWPIPSSLAQMEKRCTKKIAEGGIEPKPLPSTERELGALCARIWKEGEVEGKERQQGKITQLVPERKYAFIKPKNGGNNIFVRLRNLPKECQANEVLVEYSLEESFDPRKNCDSVEAVLVRRIKARP